MPEDTPTIQQSFPVSESDHFTLQEQSTNTVTSRVRVIATPDYYGVWLSFSPTGTTEFDKDKYYKPGEVRSISSQIINNDAPKLVTKLGSDNAIALAKELDFAADLAASLSYGDVVGMDEIKQYKRGMIDADELVNKFGLKLLDEMDAKY